MGTVIPFEPRGETATRKTEAILARIGEAYQQRMKAAADLPALLADLVRAGRSELALQALCEWGEGRLEPHQVLALIQQDKGGSGGAGNADDN